MTVVESEHHAGQTYRVAITHHLAGYQVQVIQFLGDRAVVRILAPSVRRDDVTTVYLTDLESMGTTSPSWVGEPAEEEITKVSAERVIPVRKE